VASAGLSLGLSLATGVTPAFAQTQICGNGGTGYCKNDWNGLGYGNPVKMYNGNTSTRTSGPSRSGAAGAGPMPRRSRSPARLP
jgi:hypothetical protein